jgi:hypothetical protein
LDFGFWILDFGLRIADCGLRIADCGESLHQGHPERKRRISSVRTPEILRFVQEDAFDGAFPEL